MAYFERASQIQPQEVKWKLMVASCHRRSGDYTLAFEIYRAIHTDFPDNVECLRFLVHICDDLGKKDQSHDYVVKLGALAKDSKEMEIDVISWLAAYFVKNEMYEKVHRPREGTVHRTRPANEKKRQTPEQCTGRPRARNTAQGPPTIIL